MGYDDPNCQWQLKKRSNYVQTRSRSLMFTARGPGTDGFLLDHQGGILTMADGTTTSGHRHAWGSTWRHARQQVHVIRHHRRGHTQPQPDHEQGTWQLPAGTDMAACVSGSVTRAIDSSQTGTMPRISSLPTVLRRHPSVITIHAGIHPRGHRPARSLAAIEIWNYLNSTGETYPLPSSHPPVATAAITARLPASPAVRPAAWHLPRQAGVSGERNATPHVMLAPKVRISTTLAEAQALYGSGTSTPTAPSNTAPPSVAGTRVVGNTLTGSQGSWSGVPTPLLSNQWQFSYDNRAWPLKNEAGALETGLTLALTEQHAGLRVRFAVTGANSSGAPATAYSPWTTIITRSDGNYFGDPGAETA
jgi:hypothetical protein